MDALAKAPLPGGATSPTPDPMDAVLKLDDLMLYADGVLFHQLSLTLIEARAPAFMLAAPLIAVAVVRNRSWAIDIHVSRNVVFHSFTLIATPTPVQAQAFRLLDVDPTRL